MGIMVTVRERKLSTDNGQRRNSTQEQMNVKECSNSERDKCHPSSGLEVSKGNTYSKEVSTVQNTYPTVKEDSTRVDVNNHIEIVQENPTLETRQNNVCENATVKRTNHQLESSSINTRPQVHEPFAEKHVPSSVAAPTKNKDVAETQPLLYKQDIIASETKDCSNEKSKENSAKSTRKDKVKSNTEEKNLQKSQTAHTNDNFMAKVMNTAISSTKTNRADAETLIKHDVQPSVKEDMTTVINPSKSKNIDGKNAPQVEEKGCDSTTPKPFNKTSPSNHLTEKENTQVFPKHQDKVHIGGHNQMDDTVHIGSIAIRVVPAVTEDDKLKMAGIHHVPCDVVAADEQKQVASSGLEENVNSLNNEDRTKDLISASSENQIKHGLEDTLGVQCVLSSVKKSDSLKISNQQNNRNANSEITQADNAMPQNVNENQKSVDESKIRPMVEDYFQVQGEAKRKNEPHNRTHVGDMSEGKELPGLPPNEAAISNELCSEGNNEDFMLDQRKRKTVESSYVRKNRETDGNLASKQSHGPTERHSNKNEKTEAGQASHIRQRHTESQSSLSTRERQSTRNSNATKDNKGKEKPEVKAIPKERVSTIPEISALADYARLKVIVSEDEANTIQEFPPNKKEGFFPLIQSRHSRRPVFTADPQDASMKDRRLPNRTEVIPKVHKEPKPLVFPITEKEHQRTGMFKLADKDRQEKMPLDAKANEGVVDTGAKHAHHPKERNASPTTPFKNQRSEEQVSGTDAQRVHRVEQSLHQTNNPPFQAATSSAVSRPRSTSVSQQLKPLDNTTPCETSVGQVYNIEGSTATLRKDERTENTPVKVEEKRTENTRQDRLSTQHEETKAQQQRIAKQLEERQASRIEEEKKAEEIRVKHLMEENRASLAEEERRAAQREEERRARERETIAMKIKERREKQRETERKAEEKQAAQKEEEMRANQREEERRMKEIKEKRRNKIEEGRRGKLREEEERKKENEERRRVKQQEDEKAAQEEQQRRVAQLEQQRRVAQLEQQRRVAQEEQQRRAAQVEQERRVAQEEQQRRVAQEEQQRRAAQEEQQRRIAQEEQQRVAQEEQQRRVAQEEQQRRVAQEEQQRRVAQEEQQRRAAQEEQQIRAAKEERQKRAALIEEQRRAKPIEEKIHPDIDEKMKRKPREEGKEEKAAHILEEEMIKQEQKIEEQRGERHKKEKAMRTQTERDEIRAVEQEKTIIKQREENQTKEERNRRLEESQAALQEEERRVTHEWMLAQREDEINAKKREGEEEKKEKLVNHIEKERDTRVGEQKKAAQRMDALQYYAITSTDTERKPRERPLCSPLPSQQRHNPSGLGSSEDSGSHARPYRPHAPASPSPSLPRSNTSSPALGGKPLMFRVKDNTMRGSSFKSVKPRFHKNFGDDFRVGSPMERGSEREEEEQEIMRRSAGTPVYPDTGFNRRAAIKESSTFQSPYLSQDYSALLSQHKPYSRRSVALEEDDSRSVISNMSEGGESFATSAADLADLRGLYDYERPESACSFSSDVSRSLGKPPTVPPKSEKALRRAQRLTTRRIKKELSKIATDSHAGVEKSRQDTSSIPPSSTETRSSSRQTVASPHFSSPVSLAHAPTLGSSFPSSHSSFYASPHATGPISLPVASPHATDPSSLPDASPNATGPASQTAAPRTVAHVPSSPTLHHANHQAPVTQYHVESSYPHSYPLTQRKVLQDLGSGQYFVVDVPVQVKTKTFFDPETGKYVQLNVRQSGQSTALPQPQQTYSQPQLQPQMQVQLQQQPQASPAGKPFVLYQGNHSYPQDYQPQTITSVPCHRSSAPLTLHQGQQPVGESYGYPAHEMEQKSEGHRYSPEKTPYMDTVNDKDKTYSTVYNTHGPNEWFPESDTNSQLAGGSLRENDNSAHSQCQPRDIITMSELDDFMEMTDW